MNKQHVVAVLMRHNVTNVIAENLAKQHSSEQIVAQIRMLSYRNATDNPAGLLVKSIRETGQHRKHTWKFSINIMPCLRNGNDRQSSDNG